jgi:hypothetical protein
MQQLGKGKHFYNFTIKPCSSRLSRLHQGKSELQKFQNYLENIIIRA